LGTLSKNNNPGLVKVKVNNMKYWHPHLPFGQHISVSTLVYLKKRLYTCMKWNMNFKRPWYNVQFELFRFDSVNFVSFRFISFRFTFYRYPSSGIIFMIQQQCLTSLLVQGFLYLMN
jgi:hypothetical protein